jgi:hypothetical protein
MTENVNDNVEVRHDIDVLLATAREGVTALETAANAIPIPSRDKAKIQTAIRKMTQAANYIENRAHNLPVKTDKVTKTALKDALKDASQEQIEKAYEILVGKETSETPKKELDEYTPIDENAYYVVPVEGDEE